MEKIKQGEIGDIFSISFHTVNTILWNCERGRCDALALYMQCIYLSNHWLPFDTIWWDEDRVDRAKDILIHLWLIEIIRDDFEGKDYVETYYLV